MSHGRRRDALMRGSAKKLSLLDLFCFPSFLHIRSGSAEQSRAEEARECGVILHDAGAFTVGMPGEE